MANRIVSVHAGMCGIGIYAIMLPSSGFSVAHRDVKISRRERKQEQRNLDVVFVTFLYTKS